MPKNRNLTHIIAWSVFILYEVTITIVISGRMSSVLDYAIHYVLNIFFFYINAMLLFNFTKGKFTFFKTLLFVLNEIIVYMLINFALNYVLEHFYIRITRPTFPITLFLFSSLWRCIYFFGLSTAYAFARHNFISQREIIDLKEKQINSLQDKNKLEIELLNSRNEYLKLQFNPHLLFNTLNFIYNSVRKISKDGGNSVLLLSEITRYTYIVTKNRQVTTMAEEIEQIENLIELNRLRIGKNIYVYFDYPENLGDYQIIPLVLLSFVENIFKYGDLYNAKFPAQITIEVNDDVLNFRTLNLIEKNSSPLHSDRSGNNSIQARLLSYYKSAFELDITNKEHTFEVNLKIKLN